MKQLNLYIEQGSDFIKNIILHDKNDIPLNLNDKTITSFITEGLSTSPIAEFIITILDSTNGLVQIQLPNSITRTLNGTCYYDITVVDGTIVTIGAIGLIKVNFNVL